MRSSIAAVLFTLLTAGCQDPPAAPVEPPRPPASPVPADGFYRVHYTAEAEGPLPVVDGIGAHAHPRVGEPVDGFVEASLISQHDDNGSYFFATCFGRQHCGEVILLVDGDVIRGSGGLAGPERCLVDFTVDAAHADGAAAVAHVERSDRVELGASLAFRLTPRRSIVGREDPVLVDLDVDAPRAPHRFRSRTRGFGS